eukprot:gene5569-996_t
MGFEGLKALLFSYHGTPALVNSFDKPAMPSAPLVAADEADPDMELSEMFTCVPCSPLAPHGPPLTGKPGKQGLMSRTQSSAGIMKDSFIGACHDFIDFSAKSVVHTAIATLQLMTPLNVIHHLLFCWEAGVQLPGHFYRTLLDCVRI